MLVPITRNRPTQ